ncbi:MAG: hypothetical protein QM770_23825 [Tepidisphaeraceae bacterium]
MRTSSSAVTRPWPTIAWSISFVRGSAGDGMRSRRPNVKKPVNGVVLARSRTCASVSGANCAAVRSSVFSMRWIGRRGGTTTTGRPAGGAIDRS